MISTGDIVKSIAGRDSGCYFAVMAVSGNYVLICDGKSRKTDKPKRKKVKHLETGVGHSVFIADKIKNNEKVTNRELKSELKPYVTPNP